MSNTEHIIDNIVNNIDFKSSEYLMSVLSNDVKQLKNRENKIKETYHGNHIYYIFTSDFIENNYDKELLFYTLNHPTKHIFQHMANKINNVIKINIDYCIDPLSTNVKQIIYKSIQKAVKFDIEIYKPYDIKKYVREYIKNYNVKTIEQCFSGIYTTGL
jgi:hypothetical protein